MPHAEALAASLERLERRVEQAERTEQQLRDHRQRLMDCLRTLCAGCASGLMPSAEDLRHAHALLHWVATDTQPRADFRAPAQGVAQVVQFPPRATGVAATQGARA